uniref:Uncharacterized protein ORF49 n=1 Tax=Moneuplotes minuta TaxID=74792 RepID=D1LDQ2_9SPIT|nr:hypothetical protein [Moneuplotes minuta]
MRFTLISNVALLTYRSIEAVIQRITAFLAFAFRTIANLGLVDGLSRASW